MARAVCGYCKSRFFIDDIAEFGDIFCSYCLPKVRKCPVCLEIKVMRYDNDTDQMCKECKMKYHAFPNLYLILRFKTFERDNFTCRYCGRSPINDESVELHCDHVIPRAKGGEDSLENFVTACQACNSGKMDVMLNDYIIAQIKNRGSYGANKEAESKGNYQV